MVKFLPVFVAGYMMEQAFLEKTDLIQLKEGYGISAFSELDPLEYIYFFEIGSTLPLIFWPFCTVPVSQTRVIFLEYLVEHLLTSSGLKSHDFFIATKIFFSLLQPVKCSRSYPLDPKGER